MVGSNKGMRVGTTRVSDSSKNSYSQGFIQCSIIWDSKGKED